MPRGKSGDLPGLGHATGERLIDEARQPGLQEGAGAFQMRHNGIIAMDMAQDVYDGGRLMALTAALAAVGQSTHPYVMVPTFPVTTKTNMQDAWDFMHGPEVVCPKGSCAD